MIKRRDVFGWVGLAVAILALGLALLPGWVSPASEPELAGGQSGWVTWFGRRMFGMQDMSRAGRGGATEHVAAAAGHDGRRAGIHRPGPRHRLVRA